jgi:tRNA threonylcarbamoyl adenosine modification protein (Sua5/YciO/YrdC/YwlC family)
MLLHIHPQNPQARQIKSAVECLEKGGIIIYPTDTIYGIGCDIFNHKAIERICRIKQVDPLKAQLSFICGDLSDLSKYARQLSTPTYRLLKQHLPGPYTFILPASKEVPKILKSKKDTIGLRVPDHPIAQAIVSALGRPLLSASLPDGAIEAYTDPENIYDQFKNQVDIIIDGGIGGIIPSTIVDLSHDTPELIRKGLGEWEV